jgi:DNA-binding transcriptional MerR regulator
LRGASDFHAVLHRRGRSAGIKVPTIRYYEQIGLLHPPRSGGRRTFGATEVRRLIFIRRARELGFEIEVIRKLLALQDMPERSCEEVDAMTRDHLTEIDEKIRELISLRDELMQTLDRCAGGWIAECRVIQNDRRAHLSMNRSVRTFGNARGIPLIFENFVTKVIEGTS